MVARAPGCHPLPATNEKDFKMTLTQNEKNRFADDIALETMIRVLGLNVAKQDNPEEVADIDELIADLNESRDKFFLLLPNATSERQVEIAKYRIEQKMKRADSLLRGLHKRPQEDELWDAVDFWTNRSPFNADRFCDTVEDDLDFLPF
jgi:hypothetical protein